MKGNAIRNSMIILLLLLALTAGLVVAQDGLSHPWATVDGGGGLSTGSGYQVQGTVGQPDAGLLAGGAFAVHGGFWPRVTAPTQPPDDGYATYLPQVSRP